MIVALATHTRSRARVAVVAVGGAAVVAAATLAIGDPNRGGFPACPVHALTGLQCPGCGAQRAMHALLTGHLATAAHDNLLAVIALPFLVYAYISWATRAFATAPLPAASLPTKVLRLLVPLVVMFTVARNLPLGHALAPLTR